MDYYSKFYRFRDSTIQDFTDILQKLFSNDLLTMNNNEKFDFIEAIFISEFLQNFNCLIQECDENAVGGIYAKVNAIQSILNYVAIRVPNTFLATEMSAGTKLPNLDLKTSKQKKTDGNVRVDISLKNKNTGLVTLVKYGGKSNATDALLQTETYANLLEVQKVKIFIGMIVSANKKVTMAHR